MYIHSIISSRQGYEKLRQRTAQPDGIGTRGLFPELDDTPVYASILEGIERFQIEQTRVDHAEQMNELSDVKYEPFARISLTTKGSAMATAYPGRVHIRWSSTTDLEDGQFDGLRNGQTVLPHPPQVLPLVTQVWRDLFPTWEDSGSQPSGVLDSSTNVGLIRQGVALNFMLGRSMIDAWLFQRVPVAARRSVIDLAVGVFIYGPRGNSHYLSRVLRGMSGGFQRAEHSLKELQPISLEVPFVLIGLSATPVVETSYLELDAETRSKHNAPAIERVIEVPAQYQQAVLGILGYFGTYLQQIAPECAAAATIRIEQGTGFLRLVVEAENGARHILEKAFDDYQGVVTGDLSVDQLPLTAFAAAELKNELRLAHARIEFQKDMLAAQGLQLKTLRELSLGLVNRKSPDISVHVSSVAHASSAVAIDMRSMLEEAEKLASMLQQSEDTREISQELGDVKSALEDAGKAPSELAGPMSKVKKILETLQSGGAGVNAALEKTAGAVETAQKLARRYNAVAEWCGLPQVPRAFTGSDT